VKIAFTSIGVVHNAIKTRHEMPCKGVASEIHIAPKYRDALFKIDHEKHLWILCYLHQARRNVLRAKPRKSTIKNRQIKGIFCIHSPDRPNPIALTKVRLLRRKGLILYVDRLDVIDTTPVLDIKRG
jgi:tRNA (adenine37-N6)-methyltransferase